MTAFDFNTRFAPSGALAFFTNRGRMSEFVKKVTRYPLYTPPHPGRAMTLSAAELDANFSYFLEQKNQRLIYLNRLLDDYSLAVDVNDANVSLREYFLKLDAWADQLWPAIRNDFILEQHHDAFEGEGLDLNIRSLLFDVAVLLGELYLRHDENARWRIDPPEPDEDEPMPTTNRIVVCSRQPLSEGHMIDHNIDPEATVFFHYRALNNSELSKETDRNVGRILGELVLTNVDHVERLASNPNPYVPFNESNLY